MEKKDETEMLIYMLNHHEAPKKDNDGNLYTLWGRVCAYVDMCVEESRLRPEGKKMEDKKDLREYVELIETLDAEGVPIKNELGIKLSLLGRVRKYVEIAIHDREQLAKLNHPVEDKNDWHERGDLPPVGTKCEYAAIKQDSKAAIIPGNWYSGTIVAYYEGYVWTSDNGIRRLSNTRFRPLQTERERWIETAGKVAVGSRNHAEFLGRLYDAGLAKMPES